MKEVRLPFSSAIMLAIFGNIIMVEVAAENQRYNIRRRHLQGGSGGSGSGSGSSSSSSSSRGSSSSYGRYGTSSSSSSNWRNNLTIKIVVCVLFWVVVVVICCCKIHKRDDDEGTTTNNNTNNRRKPILSIPTEDDFLMSDQHTKIDESYSQVHPPSGMYVGLYEQNSQPSSLSPFQLYFTQQYQENDNGKPTNTCSITGEGADTVGSYKMLGKTCGSNVSITKQYIPNTGDPIENLGHRVHLRLTKVGSTLTGKYYVKTHKWQGSGVYHIWLHEDTTTVTANAVAMPLEPIMAEAHVLPVAIVAEVNEVCSTQLINASSSPTPRNAPIKKERKNDDTMAPKKYIKTDGKMMMNPAYKVWKNREEGKAADDTAAAPTFFKKDTAADDGTTTSSKKKKKKKKKKKSQLASSTKNDTTERSD
mmetsp:Transcript_12498/g.13713  ORF Transcript_12498/g.13713 Transcript_12498/m.13713 type:complete len:420 (-) Transcript_12498:183-1442(-)